MQFNHFFITIVINLRLYNIISEQSYSLKWIIVLATWKLLHFRIYTFVHGKLNYFDLPTINTKTLRTTAVSDLSSFFTPEFFSELKDLFLECLKA